MSCDKVVNPILSDLLDSFEFAIKSLRKPISLTVDLDESVYLNMSCPCLNCKLCSDCIRFRKQARDRVRRYRSKLKKKEISCDIKNV